MTTFLSGLAATAATATVGAGMMGHATLALCVGLVSAAFFAGQIC
ncbi:MULTISPECIES: hypothetical protein [Mycobacteriaceae]|uniref:Uncharacterized protein n=1 Tax=[Mycobacterium] holstebronense TaxID=3064288 RepID=A0ABM9LFK3_9MYCO|nr:MULTISPECIES: hypothetical protein [Mycolicibacter]CAJ1498174.1 hypothetical protein MU0102_000651 [Mycolicibacter sp. MU0102]